MNSNINIENIKSIDEFYAKTQSTGSMAKAIGNNIWGINHQGIKAIIPDNKDCYGLAFFTRPQLNLKDTNLRNVRKLYSYLARSGPSMTGAVRSLLDPRLYYNGFRSPLVDPEQAFIPVLTNNLKSMSGWPDEVLPTFTSKEGLRREQWMIGDGTTDIYDAQNLECTFRNTQNEPITMMMHVWTTYISYVFEGMMSPYMDFILENEIDYNTRVYRIVLDETKRFVKKIAACGASFPVNNPMGKFFDFSDGTKYSDQTKDINIRLAAMGMMYNDDILIKEFNETSGIFNSRMRDLANTGSTSLWKVPEELKMELNNRGYFYINPKTSEFEIYVDKDSPTVRAILATRK